MQNNSKAILKHNQLDVSKIVHDEFVELNKQYVMSKMWYQETDSSPPQTCYVQTNFLKLNEVTDDSLTVVAENKNLYEQLDDNSLQFVKSKNITKKYGLKGTKYRTIITTPSDGSKDCIRLKIQNGVSCKPTQFFTGKDRTSKVHDDVKNLLKAGAEVKLIFELDGLMVDLKHNIIYVNILLKQVLIPKMSPVRVELVDYSFVDSDDESNNSCSKKELVQEKNVQSETVDNSSDKTKHKKAEKMDKLAKRMPEPSPESDSDSDEKSHSGTSNSGSDSDTEDSASVSSEDSLEGEDVENFIKELSRK